MVRAGCLHSNAEGGALALNKGAVTDHSSSSLAPLLSMVAEMQDEARGVSYVGVPVQTVCASGSDERTEPGQHSWQLK